MKEQRKVEKSPTQKTTRISKTLQTHPAPWTVIDVWLVGPFSWMKAMIGALNVDHILEILVTTEHFGKGEEVALWGLHSGLPIKSEHQIILHYQMSWLMTGLFCSF